MIAGIMRINVLLRDVHSLKQKRQVVKSIKQKLTNRYNISIIESNHQELWQNLEISIAMLSNEKLIIEKVFNEIENILYVDYALNITKIDKDFIYES